MSNSMVVDQLPQLLTWRAGTDVVRLSCEVYARCSYRRLHEWCQFGGSDLYQEILKMPKTSQKRLLLAPRLIHLLHKDQPGISEMELLGELVAMEQYLCGQSTVRPKGKWSALGDCYLPKADDNAMAGSSRGWNTDQRYDAPRAGHIVLDAYSPIWSIRAPEPWGDAAMHDGGDLELIQKRVEDALHFIASVSDVAAATVGASIQNIALVKTPNRPQRVSSASARGLIGRMMLSNAQSDCWDTANIVDALVHEATHSLIYKLQLTTPLYRDDEAAETITAVSPWSGRTLPLHSFVHACFVWYGLWHFWSMASKGQQNYSRYVEQARTGFLQGPLLSAVSAEAYGCIQPDVRSAIGELSRHVA